MNRQKIYWLLQVAWFALFVVFWMVLVPRIRTVSGSWERFGLYMLAFAVLIFVSEIRRTYRAKGEIAWGRHLAGRVAIFLGLFTLPVAAIAFDLRLSYFLLLSVPTVALGIIYQHRLERISAVNPGQWLAAVVVWVAMAAAAVVVWRVAAK